MGAVNSAQLRPAGTALRGQFTGPVVSVSSPLATRSRLLPVQQVRRYLANPSLARSAEAGYGAQFKMCLHVSSPNAQGCRTEIPLERAVMHRVIVSSAWGRAAYSLALAIRLSFNGGVTCSLEIITSTVGRSVDVGMPVTISRRNLDWFPHPCGCGSLHGTRLMFIAAASSSKVLMIARRTTGANSYSAAKMRTLTERGLPEPGDLT